jgi:hypothetical protein
MYNEFLESFFVPSDEITKQLALASSGEVTADISSLPDFVLELAREDIALRLWGYLAILARKTVARQGGTKWGPFTHIPQNRTDIIRDLARDLAIDEKYWALVENLWNSFLEWLSYQRTYRAPWGIISLSKSDLIFRDVWTPEPLDHDYVKGRRVR